MYGAPGSQTNQATVTAAGQDEADTFKSAAGMAKAFGIDPGVVLSIPEIHNAKRVAMLFPLENGESPVWQFEPRNPMFRKFGSSCNSILPRLGFSARNTAAKTTAAEPAAPSTSGPASDQNYARLVEDLIAENAQTWMVNRFVAGSVKSVSILSRDSSGRPSKVVAPYLFNGFNGRSQGSVTLTFADGLPGCLYFFDFPNTCRTPSRRIATAYSQGEYKSKCVSG